MTHVGRNYSSFYKLHSKTGFPALTKRVQYRVQLTLKRNNKIVVYYLRIQLRERVGVI